MAKFFNSALESKNMPKLLLKNIPIRSFYVNILESDQQHSRVWLRLHHHPHRQPKVFSFWPMLLVLTHVFGQAWKGVPDWQACQQTQWPPHKVRLTRADHDHWLFGGKIMDNIWSFWSQWSTWWSSDGHPDRRPWCRSFSRYDLMSHLRLMPWFRSDLLLASSDWGSLVVGRISPTIDVDSPLPSVRANSEARLMQELK